MLFENEIVSLQEIQARFNIQNENPLLFTLYLRENPLLSQDERDQVNEYIRKLRVKQTNIDRYNSNYLK